MRYTAVLITILAVLLATGLCAQVTVVNMIPNTLSNETNQDSEPNVAVNPANRVQVAGSAFTPDPLGGTNAPIFVSVDGGATWALNLIVPFGNSSTGTGDITLRFGGVSSQLYAGTLRGDSFLRMNILRTNNFTAATPMTVLVDRTNEDQPYTQAATVYRGTGTGNDRLYVGNNNFSGAGSRTASIDQSLDAVNATPPPPSGLTTAQVEVRGTGTAGQDGPPIRPAIHLDGTVYAIFYRWTAFSGTAATADVVVVRDDNWAMGATPFAALLDPPAPTGDGLSGFRVVRGITVPWANSNQATFGQERFVGSNLSIAADPRDSSTVYIAWADYPAGTTTYTLHVRRSTNRGATWSADLLTIANATNPALAVNTHGRVGFLYQQLTGTGAAQRWETHLQHSPDSTTWTDLVLARPLVGVPTRGFGPYQGDYLHLMSLGKDFYGIFSAENAPVMANFPNGVQYQRNIDAAAGQLRNLANTATVGTSIDPFFFHLTMVAPAADFYVRDWTDSPTNGDTGLEPSTHPWFFVTSDVWNRRGTLPGSFPNDQPQNEDAGNGTSTIGDNWAFARVRRNALPTSGSENVLVHFLVSKLGTGSNYADAGSGDPDLTFDPDFTVPFSPADLGPITTPAFHWHLNAVTTTHLCLAVEISTSNDPYVAPSLVGNAPGWPTTDLRVINDNNKAQRNMGLSTTPARGVGGSVSLCAIAHNAGTAMRDFSLRYDAAEKVQQRLRNARIEIIGAEGEPFRSGETVYLKRMLPGENRWVCLSFEAPDGEVGEILPVNFYEVVNDTVVNGFALGARLQNTSRVLDDTLELHRSVFLRLQKDDADRESSSAQALRERRLPETAYSREYLRFVTDHLRSIQRLTSAADGDGFRLRDAFTSLATALASRSAESVSVAHASLLQRFDSLLTMRQLARGDVADILQNIRWQKDIITRRELTSPCAAQIREAANQFIREYGARKRTNKDYPQFLFSILSCLREQAITRELQDALSRIEQSTRDLVMLQKAHRDFLLLLDK